jgi:hypothetical protein
MTGLAAHPASIPKRESFRFPDAANLAPGERHMHNVALRFTDAAQFSSAWRFYDNGLPKLTEGAEYYRQRPPITTLKPPYGA